LVHGTSRFNNQNEMIRSLLKQLETTERELANQRWVFEQFLRSPAWRLTYPIRALAKQARRVRQWLFQRRQTETIQSSLQEATQDGDSARDRDDGTPVPNGAERELVFPLKQTFADYYRVQLWSFLASGAKLSFPRCGNPEVTVILILYNRAELTLACLRSLQENHSVRLEIRIVDNASSDDTRQLLDRIEGVHLIWNVENVNFLAAVNQAACTARGEYLLLLNNDAQLLPGSLASAVATLRSAPDIGAVGGRIILLDGTLQEAGSIIWSDASCAGYGRGDDPFAPMYMFRRDVDYCSGAFLLTPRAIWEELGGFDELFRPAYYEETDYCTRLWDQGLRVVYEPNAVVLHYEFASSDFAETAIGLQRRHQALFAQRHHHRLGEQGSPGSDPPLKARLHDREQRRVLFIDDRVPHTWLGSGFPRARTVLFTLVKLGYFVTFYPVDGSSEEWWSVYSDMPREVEFMMGYGSSMFEAFLRTRSGYYGTIFVSRPHNMNLMRPIVARNPEWFEHVDIIYDSEAFVASREVVMHAQSGAPLLTEEVSRMIEEEVALASIADCVVSVSEYERTVLHKHGIGRVHVLGHALSAMPTPRPFEARSGFLFVGAFHKDASPNTDSIIWFLTEIYPKIHAELVQAPTVTIVGFHGSDKIRKLAGPSVQVTGPVPDLTELYDSARVFIAPTRYSAGIPHKIHEAAARGLPVVATPLLVRQLGWQDGSHLLVGADTESFAKKCVELYTNRTLWMALREAGLRSVQADCSPTRFENQLREIFAVKRSGSRARLTARCADAEMDR
jgi:GT2 family glycosyltransferase